MDEWVMERYELAKERIAQIPDEKTAEEPYRSFFAKEAVFLQQVIAVMDKGIQGKSLEELQKQNHELYQDILPECRGEMILICFIFCTRIFGI